MRTTTGLLCIACLLIATTALAQSTTILTLDRGQAYEMTRDAQQERWSVRVYVTPSEKFAKEPIAVAIRGVTAGSRSDSSLGEMFEEPRRYPEKGRVVAFDLTTRDRLGVARG